MLSLQYHIKWLKYEIPSFRVKYNSTRRSLFRRYILDVLMHTTAWDWHWEGDETFKWVLIYTGLLCLAWYCNIRSLISACLLDPSGLRVIQSAYFSLLAYTKQLLLGTFFDTTAGIGSGTAKGRQEWGRHWHRCMDRQTLK